MYLRLKRLADDLRCHIKDVELLELMRDHWKNPEGEVDLNEAANIEAYFLSSLRNAFEISIFSQEYHGIQLIQKG